MDWKKFWAPLTQERTKEKKWSTMWPNIISALGIFPGCLLAREYLNVWWACGLVISWYFIVYFVWLIYLFNKK